MAVKGRRRQGKGEAEKDRAEDRISRGGQGRVGKEWAGQAGEGRKGEEVIGKGQGKDRKRAEEDREGKGKVGEGMVGEMRANRRAKGREERR